MAYGVRRNEPRNRNQNSSNRKPEDQNNMAEVVATLQRRMTEQDLRMEEQLEEIRNLRQQLDLRGNGGTRGSQRNPSESKTDNTQSQAGENTRSVRWGHGEDQPPVQPLIRQEPLYGRFGKMKPAEFTGSTDPLEAEEWLSSIETILDFMELSDHERVMCATYMLKKDARHWWGSVKLRKNVNNMTWGEFVEEFNQKYYNPTVLRAQQNEFLNLKQGNMTVVDAV